MKINYISPRSINEAGLFKNRVQAQAALAKDDEMSDEDIIVKSADVIFNSMRQAFQDNEIKRAVVLGVEYIFNSVMHQNISNSGQLMDSVYHNPHTDALARNNTISNFADGNTLGKYLTKKLLDTAVSNVANSVSLTDNYWKTTKGITLINSIAKKCSEVDVYVGMLRDDSEVFNMMVSDKRAFLAMRRMNSLSTSYFYTQSCEEMSDQGGYAWSKMVIPDNRDIFRKNGEHGFTFTLAVVLSGKDYDTKGMQAYQDVMDCYVNKDIDNPLLDDYYAKVYRETIASSISNIKNDLVNIKNASEDLICSMLKIYTKQNFSKELILKSVPDTQVHFEIVFCRPSIGAKSTNLLSNEKDENNRSFSYNYPFFYGLIPIKNIPRVRV